MRLCIASGKGGTGKTTVATNLAQVAGRLGRSVAYVDCDVEDPNGHLYVRPEIERIEPVTRPIPLIDRELCSGCGDCVELCQYNALAYLADQVLLFADLCHSCGGCRLVCPTGAISESRTEIGQLERGAAEEIAFLNGRLKIGEAKSPPLIRAVREAAPRAELVIVDAPPGTSCPVVESLRGADLVLLVTEPTPFGLHDLKLAVDVVRQLERPFALVVNRSAPSETPTLDYCREEGIDVLGKIPDDRAIAEAYSRGELACEVSGEYRVLFENLLAEVGEALKRS